MNLVIGLFLIVTLSNHHVRCSPLGLFGSLDGLNNAHDVREFEGFLEVQIQQVLNPLDMCRIGPIEVADTADELALRLKAGVQGKDGELLMKSMIKSLAMDDVIHIETTTVKTISRAKTSAVPKAEAQQPKPNHMISRATGGGLGELLDNQGNSDSLNIVDQAPRILQRQMKVNPDWLKSMVQSDWQNQEPDYQRALLRKMEALYGPEDEKFRRENQSNDEMCRLHEARTRRRRKRDLGAILNCAKSSLVLGPKALAKLLQRVALFGLNVMDQLYMAPEFIEKIPILGENIMGLRERGRPFYKIINVIREAWYMYKVSTAPEGTDETSEPHDPHRVSQAKRMIGDAGMDALKWLVESAIDRFAAQPLGESERRELLKRASFALLAQVLPQQSAQSVLCKLG